MAYVYKCVACTTSRSYDTYLAGKKEHECSVCREHICQECITEWSMWSLCRPTAYVKPDWSSLSHEEKEERYNQGSTQTCEEVGVRVVSNQKNFLLVCMGCVHLLLVSIHQLNSVLPMTISYEIIRYLLSGDKSFMPSWINILDEYYEWWVVELGY